MDKKKDAGSQKPSQQDSAALLDLQEFFEKELSGADARATSRVFVPLTDGLGLESPKQKDAAFQVEVPKPPPIKFDREFPQRKSDVSILFDEAPSPVEPAPVEQPIVPVAESRLVLSEPDKIVAPPPIPQPSFFRRAMAAMIDELFVLTLWIIALVITSNLLTGFSTGVSNQVFKELGNPLFLRFAILEFATIWLSYLAICLGVMDVTFGMWVWGIRVSYGGRSEGNFALRKLMRIVWGFLFYAPVAPLVFLLFHRKGRNLLDALSGTNVYFAH